MSRDVTIRPMMLREWALLGCTITLAGNLQITVLNRDGQHRYIRARAIDIFEKEGVYGVRIECIDPPMHTIDAPTIEHDTWTVGKETLHRIEFYHSWIDSITIEEVNNESG